jgi:hypothetical protein
MEVAKQFYVKLNMHSFSNCCYWFKLAKGQITAELRAAMSDNTVRIAHLYEEVSFIAIAALMVLKPF